MSGDQIMRLTRIFSSNLMSSESSLAKVFIGFAKDINDNTPVVDTLRRSSDNPPDMSHHNPGLFGFSDPSATFQYRELNPFFECVFISPLLVSQSTECIMDMRLHAQIWGKKRSPYFFTSQDATCH